MREVTIGGRELINFLDGENEAKHIDLNDYSQSPIRERSGVASKGIIGVTIPEALMTITNTTDIESTDG